MVHQGLLLRLVELFHLEEDAEGDLLGVLGLWDKFNENNCEHELKSFFEANFSPVRSSRGTLRRG